MIPLTIETLPKFCITLPEKPQRTIAARDHFNALGLLGVTFVPGINGPVAGIKTIFPYTIDDPSGNFFTGHHECGLFLSHYICWVNILLNHDYGVILEDDCQLRPNWKAELESALRDCPSDMDWLFCGSCGVGTYGGKQRIKGNVWDVRYPGCNHMYIVSRRGCRVLTNTQRKMWAPIDISVIHKDPRGGSQSSFDNMHVYTIHPRIADQKDTVIPD